MSGATKSERVLARTILRVWEWPGAGGEESMSEEAGMLRAFVGVLQEAGYIERDPGPSGPRLRFTLTEKARDLLRRST